MIAPGRQPGISDLGVAGSTDRHLVEPAAPTIPGRSLGDRFAPALLLGPYLVLLVVFGLGPAAYAVLTSFSDPKRNGIHLVGVDAYRFVVHDFRFEPAIVHLLKFMAAWLPTSLLAVVLLALLLHVTSGTFATAARLAYFVPAAVGGVASVLMWLFMLDPGLSPFGWLLHLLGFSSLSQLLLVPNLPWVFAVMSFIPTVGFWVVVVYGALVDIPPSLIEAAKIDGANPFQLARLLKLPLIRKYLAFMLIVSVAEGTQLFVAPQTVGGLGSTSIATWSLNQLAYQYAFGLANYPAAAAISIMLLGVGALAALIILKTTRLFGDTHR